MTGVAAPRRSPDSRPGSPHRSRPALLGLLAAGALVGLVACGSEPAVSALPADTATTTGTAPGGHPDSTGAAASSTATAAPTLTVTRTAPGAVITAAPPAATAAPAPTPGSCPYLSDEQVTDINGQRTGQTSVIAVAPHPTCVFTRSDGGWLATVQIIGADTEQSAVAAVNQHVPIDASDPAGQPAGWSGGSMVTDEKSVYAVSKGTTAIVAESNQLQSIKGRQMVIAAVAALGL